jgi:hypothetical protein
MALTYGEISAVTQSYFVPKIVDNIFASNAALSRWRKKNYERVDGGKDIIVPLLYATTTAAGRYSGTDTLSTTSNDQITAAAFDWKQYYGDITISRLDENKNAGKAAVVSFLKTKVQACEKSLASLLGTDIFGAGTTTNSFPGLAAICAGTGTTYGGISKTTYSWWRGQADASTTIITLPVLQSMIGDCQIDSDRPTAIFTTQNLYDKIFACIQPQQRFQDSDTARAGFTSLLFNGIPVIVDSHCTASYLYAINENYISLIVHSDEDFRFEPFQRPVNQNVGSAKIYWTGSLTCSNCRMQGWKSTLTE